MASESHRPIFVIGCPRSGTTLLQLMLHSHHRIAVPAETRFVHVAYRKRREFGDLEVAGNRHKLAKWITGKRSTKFHTLGLDRAQIIDEIVAAPPTLGSALATVFRAYAREHGKARWGDKRPSYFRKVALLRRMFPDAQFVHLIRDGRDATGSLKGMPWYGGDFYTATLTWRESIERGRRLARELGPDTYFELQYENLVDDPEPQLRALCSFLGEDYDPAMTEPHTLARQTVPAKRRWHARTHQGPNTQRVGAWHERLEPWELGLVEHVAGGQLTAYGYPLSGAPRPSMAHRAHFVRAALHRRYVQRKAMLYEAVKARREPNPVDSRLTGSALLSAPTPLHDATAPPHDAAGEAGPAARPAG